MIVWLKRIFKKLSTLNHITVNWDTWGNCYDYGVDRFLFLKRELCSCRHRDYSHNKYGKMHLLSNGTVWYTQPCTKCSCTNFKPMSNLEWLEYSSERVPEIKSLSSRDCYDYFDAVTKGDKSEKSIK